MSTTYQENQINVRYSALARRAGLVFYITKAKVKGRPVRPAYDQYRGCRATWPLGNTFSSEEDRRFSAALATARRPLLVELCLIRAELADLLGRPVQTEPDCPTKSESGWYGHTGEKWREIAARVESGTGVQPRWPHYFENFGPELGTFDSPVIVHPDGTINLET